MQLKEIEKAAARANKREARAKAKPLPPKKPSAPPRVRKPTSPMPSEPLDTPAPAFPLTALRRHYVLRPVNWRFQLATQIISRRLRMPRSRGDAGVSEIVRMLRAWNDARTDMSQLAVAEAYLDLFNAWEIFQQPFESIQRQSVECFILADMPLDEIGQWTNCTPTMIQWYEDAFFDIRSRLGRQSVVLPLAVENAPATPGPPVLRERRRLSYAGGPLMAKAMLFPRTKRDTPSTMSEVRGFFESDFDQTLLVNASLAMRTLDPANPRTGRQLQRLELARRFVEGRRRAEQNEYDDVNQAFRAEIRAALDAVPRELLSPSAGQSGPASQTVAAQPK